MYNRVAVGKVKNIALDPRKSQWVKLVFAIEQVTPIKTETVAILKTQRLKALSYVLAGGDRDAAVLLTTTPQQPYPKIPPSLGARIGDVLSAVPAKPDRTSGNTQARQLAPLIVHAIGRSGAFRAVGPIENGIFGQLRLETEILKLQQEFEGVPSSVRFTMQVYLIDNATNDVVASRDFDQAVPSASEDLHGGVVAGDREVQEVLAQLIRFCAEAARGFRLRLQRRVQGA
jgi:hypothetical protein